MVRSSPGGLASPAVILGAVAALAVAVTAQAPADRYVAPLAFLLVIGTIAHRRLLTWRSVISGIILLILFVPIRRYAVAGHLPFALEPYRIVVAVAVAAWMTALLVDRRVRVKRIGLEGPFALIVGSALISLLFNAGRVAQLGSEVVKGLTFLISFLFVVYLVASVVRSRADVDGFVKLLVAGSSILSVLAVYEHWSGKNIFDDLAGVIPLLKNADFNYSLAHDFPGRAYASAQHPIAFGAALVLVLPLTLYLHRLTQHRRWLWAAATILLGIFASGSRTAILMLVAVAFVYLRLRPRETKRMWPALIPLLVLVHFALPSTLGSLKASFFPKGGIVQQQDASANTRGSGRLADLGPSLRQAEPHLFFGLGYGTRITDKEPSRTPRFSTINGSVLCSRSGWWASRAGFGSSLPSTAA